MGLAILGFLARLGDLAVSSIGTRVRRLILLGVNTVRRCLFYFENFPLRLLVFSFGLWLGDRRWRLVGLRCLISDLSLPIIRAALATISPFATCIGAILILWVFAVIHTRATTISDSSLVAILSTIASVYATITGTVFVVIYAAIFVVIFFIILVVISVSVTMVVFAIVLICASLSWLLNIVWLFRRLASSTIIATLFVVCGLFNSARGCGRVFGVLVSLRSWRCVSPRLGFILSCSSCDFTGGIFLCFLLDSVFREGLDFFLEFFVEAASQSLQVLVGAFFGVD